MSQTVTAETLAASLPALLPALMDVDQVAAWLNCSPRSVYRVADGGKIPKPIKLGGLVRWNRAELEEFVASGCKPVRSAGRPAQ